jgi:hypothetical protein
MFDRLLAVSPVYKPSEAIAGAQMSTGACNAVLALMADIAQHPGHHDASIAQQGSVMARQYDQWSAACRGPNSYSQRLVDAVHKASERSRAAARTRSRASCAYLLAIAR